MLTTTNDINLKHGQVIEDQNGNQYKIEGAAFPGRLSKLNELILKLRRLEKL